MYLPSHFEERDIEKLQSAVELHPLATWIVASSQQLAINHIPFLLDKDRGQYGTLAGHVARTNSVWKLLANNHQCAAVFQGEQSYVSPSWYPSKHEHHRAVPTWNYVVVHAHGVARAIEDRDWLLQLVTRLSDKHEADQPTPWHVSQAPADYLEKMLEAIVGIEIPIDKLVGKFKLSQNRSRDDQHGIVAGLHQAGDTDSVAMAELMKRKLDQ